MKDMESINDGDIATSIKPMDKSQKEHMKRREYKLVYKNLVMFGYFHLAGLYGLYLCFTSAKWQTIIFSVVFYMLSIIGITAGSHRLWAHRTYKAKMPLQIILMILNCIAFQSIIIQWVRDHRLHHKYTDTDVDPHNAKRGFFYSHIGWLLVRKLPEVKKYGREIDLSDLYNNPVLKFQERYAVPLIGFSCFVLPTIMPMYFWGENLNTAYHMCMFRYITNLNATFMVNSAAHMWGYKPYDKSIMPSHNFAIILTTLGEGFHNYHHVFPWDYRAAEFGNNKLNLTTMFIDFFARIGWAYDLKTVPEDMIRRRAKKTGDGTNLWGFEDKDISSEDKNYLPQRNVNRNVFVLKNEVKLEEIKHHVFIHRLQDKWRLIYRAFCSGSIIAKHRVLTSAHCFFTNRKRYKYDLKVLKVVAGAMDTIQLQPVQNNTQQWRRIDKIFTQKYYRFPAYNLAVLEIDEPWVFNQFVGMIPYASRNKNYNGVCTATVVKSKKSGSTSKYLVTEKHQIIQRKTCERTLLRSCRLYYCTAYKNDELAITSSETEGGGFICYGTGDIEEQDEKQGILVGVTSLINIRLPSLHSRIGLFHQWVTDSTNAIYCSVFVVTACLLVII